MRVVTAEAKDSKRLTNFFSSLSLPGNMEITLNRTHNFFDKYNLFSNDHITLMLVDDKNELQATATLVFVNVVIGTSEQTIGLATDLRIAKNRKALLAWSDIFLPVLLEERAKRECKYFFSPIAQSRVASYRSFIRPRSVNRNFPRYHLFRRFNITTLHGIYPWASSPLTTIDIRPAHVSDISALQDYIKNRQKLMPFYIPQKHTDLLGMISHWPGLKISDFLMAFDKDKNIIGCASLWDTSNVETIQVINKTKRVKTFEQTLKTLSYLGITRALFNSSSNTLNMMQLNFLYANNPDIFYSLLRRAFQVTPKTHFLAYLNFENQKSFLPPRGFISQGVPYNLYCLLAPGDNVPEFLKPTFLEKPPDIDLAVI